MGDSRDQVPAELEPVPATRGSENTMVQALLKSICAAIEQDTRKEEARKVKR